MEGIKEEEIFCEGSRYGRIRKKEKTNDEEKKKKKEKENVVRR